jgi:hypothetical protein
VTRNQAPAPTKKNLNSFLDYVYLIFRKISDPPPSNKLGVKNDESPRKENETNTACERGMKIKISCGVNADEMYSRMHSHFQE